MSKNSFTTVYWYRRFANYCAYAQDSQRSTMLEELARYCSLGVPLQNDLLIAVATNDLKNAVRYADSAVQLERVTGIFYNVVPSLAWGSRDQVRNWTEIGGTLEGQKELDTDEGCFL